MGTADEARTANPDEPFVAFHLAGMVEPIDALHDRVNAPLRVATRSRRLVEGLFRQTEANRWVAHR